MLFLATHGHCKLRGLCLWRFRKRRGQFLLRLLSNCRLGLRPLAQAALQQYGLGEAQIVFVAYSNVLFYRGEARPIDFDDCGYGYWIYDLATPLAHWQTHPQWPVYRRALLDGYLGVRALPDEQLAHLDLFMAARHGSEMLWGIDQAQSKPSFRQELEGWLEWAALHVNRYKEAL